MIKVNKEINLSQLDAELSANGLNADLDDNGTIIAVGLADNSTITIEQLKSGIETHKAIFEQLSVEEKLASVGLSLDDLKTALGL